MNTVKTGIVSIYLASSVHNTIGLLICTSRTIFVGLITEIINYILELPFEEAGERVIDEFYEKK